MGLCNHRGIYPVTLVRETIRHVRNTQTYPHPSRQGLNFGAAGSVGFVTSVVSGAGCYGQSSRERRILRHILRRSSWLVMMVCTEAMRSFMQVVEAIRSVMLALLFLILAPLLGLVAAFTHDRRYDELLDDW